MSGRVAGKRVLVTGAARGMGRSHAIRLAEEGADLILIDLCESLPGLAYPLAARQDLEETAGLGGLDAAVANAGVSTAGTWDATTAAQWRLVLDVNLIGVWNTCTAAIPHLVEHGGSLVNISSAAGIKGTPLSTPYPASKHGVVGMSVALANELAAQNIRVNTVHPTGVLTGMMPGLRPLLANDRPDLAPIYANALPVELVNALDVSR